MIQITDPKVLPIGGGDDTNDAGMVYVRDYRSITFMVATTGSANMTIKFAGSLQEDKPDLEAAQSQSNLWDHIEVVDLQDGSAIDGAAVLQVNHFDVVPQVALRLGRLEVRLVLLQGAGELDGHVRASGRGHHKGDRAVVAHVYHAGVVGVVTAADREHFRICNLYHDT